MQAQKHVYRSSFFYIGLLFFIFIFLLEGCQPDDADDDIFTPDTDVRDDFVGNWLCDENSQVYGPSTYNVTIEKNSNNDSTVLIRNFYHAGQDEVVEATVEGTSIVIDHEIICEGIDEQVVWGDGEKIDNNTINWIYYANDYAETDTATSTYIRQ